MSATSSRSATPTPHPTDDEYASDTFASDPSLAGSPSANNKKEAPPPSAAAAEGNGNDTEDDDPNNGGTPVDASTTFNPFQNAPPPPPPEETATSSSQGKPQQQDGASETTGARQAGTKANGTSRSSNPPAAPLMDSLSATRRSVGSGSNSRNATNATNGEALSKDKKPVSAKLKYASSETFFSPSHLPISGQSEKALLTRLYNPEPLKKRTLLEMEKRRQQQQVYDSSLDHHLSQFWDRQQVLRGKRGATVGGEDGTTSGQRPHTTSPRTAAAGPPPPSGAQTASDSGSPTSSHHKRKKANYCSASSASPGSSRRGGGGGGQHSSSAWSSSSRSPSGSSSSRGSNPEWTEQRSVNDSRHSPQWKAKSSKRQKNRQQQQQQNASAGATSPFSSKSKRGAGPAVLVGSLPGHVWSTVALWLDGKDAAALHRTAKGLAADALAKAASAAVTVKIDEQQQQDASNRAVALRDSTASSASRDATSPTRSRSDHDDDDDGFEPVNTIHCRDLTALWMVARPSSAFQRVVARFSFHHHDFNLNWMAANKKTHAGPTVPATVLQIPFENAVSSTPVHPDTYRLSSPRSVIVLLRNGLTLKDLVAVPLSVFYNEGSLRGLPKTVSEISYAAHEKQRLKQLGKVRRDYAALCSVVTLPALVEQIFAVNPDDHADAPLREDSAEIRTPAAADESAKTRQQPSSAASCQDRSLAVVEEDPEPTSARGEKNNGGSAKSAKPVSESALRLRADCAKLQQARQQEKYMMLLEKTAERLKQRTEATRDQEEAVLRRQAALRQQQEEEQRQRSEKIAVRAEKLKQVQVEAKLMEELRQKMVLSRIKEYEEHQKKLDEQRTLQLLIQQEERNVVNERKRDRVDRFEKQLDFERLCVVDKLRRKATRVTAMMEFVKETTKDLKQHRELGTMEMHAKADDFSQSLLAFQRKCDYDQMRNNPVNQLPTAKSSSRLRKRIHSTTAAEPAADQAPRTTSIADEDAKKTTSGTDRKESSDYSDDAAEADANKGEAGGDASPKEA